MTTQSTYKSINCSWYDRLIQACERKEELTLEIADSDQTSEKIIFKPVDIFSKDQAEWLKSSEGTIIRLDKILSVNGELLSGVCGI